MRIDTTIEIGRPTAEVFSFSTDPGRLPLWAGPVTEVKQTSDGAMVIGSTQTRVIQFMGRRIESDYEVTDYQPSKRYAAETTSGPVPIKETLSFEESPTGTRLTITGEIEAAGFFKIAEPILARVVRRQIENDAATLKDLMEAG